MLGYVGFRVPGFGFGVLGAGDKGFGGFGVSGCYFKGLGRLGAEVG